MQKCPLQTAHSMQAKTIPGLDAGKLDASWIGISRRHVPWAQPLIAVLHINKGATRKQGANLVIFIEIQSQDMI